MHDFNGISINNQKPAISSEQRRIDQLNDKIKENEEKLQRHGQQINGFKQDIGRQTQYGMKN